MLLDNTVTDVGPENCTVFYPPPPSTTTTESTIVSRNCIDIFITCDFSL